MTRRTLRIEKISGRSSRQILRDELQLSAGAADDAVLAEVLRAVTWASTRIGEPVAEHFLLDRATAVLLAQSTDSAPTIRERCARTLDDLEVLGDLTRVAAGHWISTPCYVVDLGGHRMRLLISGRPRRSLHEPLRRELQTSGPVRSLNSGVTTGLPVLTVDSWSGLVPRSLTDWTAAIMRSTPLIGSTVEAIRQRRYRFYVPGEASPTASRDQRWHPPSTKLNGRYLARVDGLTGYVDHEIVRLVNGRIAATHPCDQDTGKRLMFGLDRLAGRPVAARLVTVAGADEFTVTEALPRAETRLLFAASGGSLRSPWRVPKGNPVPQHVIRTLGLR